MLIASIGLWGNPDHVSNVAKMIRQQHSDYAAKNSQAIDFEVLLPETNREVRCVPVRVATFLLIARVQLNTYDGMDWCAERVVREARNRIAYCSRPIDLVRRSWRAKSSSRKKAPRLNGFPSWATASVVYWRVMQLGQFTENTGPSRC